MNDSELESFRAWWFWDQERKRLERTERIRLSKRDLALRIIDLEAKILDYIEKEQERRAYRPEWLKPKKGQPQVGLQLVRKLGLDRPQFRTFSFDRSTAVVADRVLELSVSSDQPVERSFGWEVLSHRSDHVDLGRMNDGGALLFNHNPDQHLGTVTAARTDGKTLRLRTTFGNSDLAKEKYADVKDGILKSASIGYQISEMTEGPRGTFTAVKWTPYEASLVTVPADPTVGVGRGF